MSSSARSTRFPIAVHILCMVAFFEEHSDEEYVSSALIAASTTKNQVVVLRIIALLREAGIVASAPGKHGGVRLAKPPGEISLFDVYKAVESQCTFGMHEANMMCPAARATTNVLSSVFEEAENAIEKTLRGKTVVDLLAEVNRDPVMDEIKPEEFVSAVRHHYVSD